jgi:hypothetical protein
MSWTLRICALLMCAIGLFATVNNFKTDRAFADHGKRALAEPPEGYTVTTTTKKKLGITMSESQEKSAHVTFITESGDFATMNRKLPDEILAKFEAGEPVYVEYLPENLELARYEGQGVSWTGSLFFTLLICGATALFWKKM